MASSAAVEPPWEKRYPGRLDYELARLREAGANPVVDEKARASGILKLDLTWDVDGEPVELTATYPDGFPRLRPLVSLRGDPDLFPDLHCNPRDGTLCLLGRDSAQWVPSWTLAKLLASQLADALKGTGEEDPQAEPGEVWWNVHGLRDSYCLVDSAWNIGAASEGSLTLRLVGRGGQTPFVRAVITEIRGGGGVTLAEWQGAVPPEISAGRDLTVQWVRVEGSFLPRRPADQIKEVLASSPRLANLKPREIAPGLDGYIFAVVYETEVQLGVKADSWLLVIVHGSRKAFAQVVGKRPEIHTIPTRRSGATDLGSRVPAIADLRTRTVALFGLGAIGAPLALELARNGCREVRLLDRDIVEPGNSVRWPLGSGSWGRKKAEALTEFIEAHFFWCRAVPEHFSIGQAEAPDDEVLARMLDGVDVAIDATASYGVTTLLYDYCRERGIPLVSLWATPPVAGGIVARYMPQGGCPVCLEHHYAGGTLEPPPGYGSEGGLVQPPGCAERTFTGGSFDLKELSLEAFRLVLDTLREPDLPAVVETLALADGDARIPPSWRSEALTPHEKCVCGA